VLDVVEPGTNVALIDACHVSVWVTRPQSCSIDDWHCRSTSRKGHLMAPATSDTPTQETDPTMRERATDAVRHVAHLSHEAQLLKSLAADAVEDGVHGAQRAIKSVQRRVEDLGDETVYRVKRQPFKAVSIAGGAGFVLGMAVGWIGGRFAATKSRCHN
jgi:ElaB/YqjD/DUF883 family membrane-anchored ribosome-binding protein